MVKFIAQARNYVTNPLDSVRAVIVLSSAAALILAERALPLL